MSTLGGLLRRELNPLLAAIICSVVLVGTLVLMIQGRAAILREGTEIVLKTAPVDPRDLMRGDYRCLYLGWLLGAQGFDPDEDEG